MIFYDFYRNKLLSVRVSGALLENKFKDFSAFIAVKGYKGKCSYGDFFEFLLQNSDKLLSADCLSEKT
jgi:hypothetical protein